MSEFCLFCFERPILPNKRHCDRPRCRRYSDELNAEYARRASAERCAAVWNMITQWGQRSENDIRRRGGIAGRLSSRARVALHTVKAIICFTMRLRSYGDKYADRYGISLGDWSLGDGSDGWSWVEVGEGWGNWWASIESDWPERGF